MSHMPIIRKRHPMLPKGARPDTWSECAKCGEDWPCEVEVLKAKVHVLSAHSEELGRVKEAFGEEHRHPGLTPSQIVGELVKIISDQRSTMRRMEDQADGVYYG